MMMSEIGPFVLAWLVGLLLGGIFFGGLWWTVRVIMVGKRAAAWLIGSLLLRMGIALTGFYLVAREHWQYLLLCVVGFMMARAIVKWLTGLSADQRSLQGSESKNAP